MKNNKIKQKIILLVMLIIILSSNNTYALGIAPSKKIIEYTTEEQTIIARIINTEKRDITIKLTAQGPLSEYVTITEPIITLKSTDSEKEIIYTLKLPEGLETGTQKINILATEIDNSENANTINAIVTITQQLQINIPYATKNIETEISTSTTTINEPVTARLTIRNSGTEKINSITGVIKILDINNNNIYESNMAEQTDLEKASTINIDKQIEIEKIGTYKIEYNIKYDEKTIKIQKEFDIGEYNITVLKTSVNNFKLGTIAKFEIQVENEWNTALENVNSEIIILNENETIIGEVKTQNTITPGKNTITLYWDTKNISTGTYTINIKISNSEKTITQKYQTTITQDKIEIQNTVIPNNEVKVAEKNNTKNTLIGIGVLIVIILIIIAVIKMQKKNKKIYK